MIEVFSDVTETLLASEKCPEAHTARFAVGVVADKTKIAAILSSLGGKYLLPRVNGNDLLNRVRSNPENPSEKLVLLWGTDPSWAPPTRTSNPELFASMDENLLRIIERNVPTVSAPNASVGIKWMSNGDWPLRRVTPQPNARVISSTYTETPEERAHVDECARFSTIFLVDPRENRVVRSAPQPHCDSAGLFVLDHPALKLIGFVAEKQLQDSQLSDLKRAKREFAAQHLCTGYDVYAFVEPCQTCCAALLHARVSRIFVVRPNPQSGFLWSVEKTHCLPEINHRFRVFREE